MPKILVVDDDIDFRQLSAALLTDAGYEVVHTGSGEDAHKILGADAFDLVVTDMMMPGMGAPGLVKLIKEKWPDMPIIAVTGTNAFESKRHTENLAMLGVNAMVEKSPRLSDLISAVAEII